MTSSLEARLLWLMQDAGIPYPTVEHQFHEGRKWRFDFAWDEYDLAVEVEGATWMPNGRHTSGAGFRKDCEKYNQATLDGWRLLRFTSDMIDDGTAIATIKAAMRKD